MNMVMDMPTRRAAVSRRIRSSVTKQSEEVGSKEHSGSLNLKGRLSGSPELYTGLNRQPFGE